MDGATLGEYALLVAVVFTVNLLPAFGPPSWTLLVFFNLKYEIPLVPLVLLGASAAACGRFVLATGARRVRPRLSERRRTDLDALRKLAETNKATSVTLLTLFAVSPLPSAQLFVAAGLTGVRLVPLTLAFFAGRLVSYTIYASAASAAAHSLDTILREGVTSATGVLLQLLMLAGLAALILIPWQRILTRFLPQPLEAEATGHNDC